MQAVWLTMDWVLELRSPGLTVLFRGLTFLGDELFFLSALPLGYWLWRKPAFGRVGLLLLFTSLLNAFLKDLWQVPRPDIPHLVSASGWAFPSGHAQAAGAMWAWLAWELKRPWAWVTAGVLIIGIAASRVYLGVHYPIDVLVGVVVGLTCALGFGLGLAMLGQRIAAWPPALPVAGLVVVLAVWLALFPSGPADAPIKAAAALAGFATGLAFDRARLRFAIPENGRSLMLAAGLGLAGVAVIWVGLKQALAAVGQTGPAADGLRYGLLGLWVAAAAPALFQKFGLYGQENH